MGDIRQSKQFIKNLLFLEKFSVYFNNSFSIKFVHQSNQILIVSTHTAYFYFLGYKNLKSTFKKLNNETFFAFDDTV